MVVKWRAKFDAVPASAISGKQLHAKSACLTPPMPFNEYYPDTPSNTVIGINNVSGGIVGIVKMAIMLWGDQTNDAIAVKLGMPVSAVNAIERSLLGRMNRLETARYNRDHFRATVTPSERAALDHAMKYDPFVPEQLAKKLNLTIEAFAFQWVFSFNRMVLFYPHYLELQQQPTKFTGRPLHGLYAREPHNCGMVYARAGEIFDEKGRVLSADEIKTYRLDASVEYNTTKPVFDYEE